MKNPIVYTLSNGKKLNKNQFLRYFEKKILYTIRKFNLIEKRKKNKKHKIAVACSGGKDSLTLTYILAKFCNEKGIDFIALAINEGIPGYRDKILKTAQDFCKKYKISLRIFYFKKEFGFNLGDKKIQEKIKEMKLSNCYVCSILKRWLINKKAKKMKIDVIATGHNIDDEAENIILNWFKGNPKLLAKLGPRTGTQKLGSFVQRIKPLYLCNTKEIVLYAKLKKIPIPKNPICPLRGETFRGEIRRWLEQMDKKHVEVRNAIVCSFLKLMPLLKEKYSHGKVMKCKKCGSISAGGLCKSCQLLRQL
jgi:uncharacterized protein (TIGR00269 family)